MENFCRTNYATDDLYNCCMAAATELAAVDVDVDVRSAEEQLAINFGEGAVEKRENQVLVSSPEGELMYDAKGGNLLFYMNEKLSDGSMQEDVDVDVDVTVANDKEDGDDDGSSSAIKEMVTDEQAIYAARAMMEHLKLSLKADAKVNKNSIKDFKFQTIVLDTPITRSLPNYSEYVDGANEVKNMTKQERAENDELARTRRDSVRAAMQHAWSGYRAHAWGKDELRPVQKGGRDTYGGIAVTLVDSLDTLWMMGLMDEFNEARDYVRDHLNHDVAVNVSVFETTIRSLGGLLSAYDLSGDPMFLKQADDLGSRLIKAFDSPTGIPYGMTKLAHRRGIGKKGAKNNDSFNSAWTGGHSILAELGTIQIEFRYLAHATGKQHYADKANKVFELMREIAPENGLYPIFINNSEGPGFATRNNKITFGAMGDSFYEYMLKVWLQGGRTEQGYRDMWDQSMDGLHDFLLHRSLPGGLHYIADLVDDLDKQQNVVHHKMDHLVCFLGGAMALGAYTDPRGLFSKEAQRDLKTGKALAYTCYQMYARMFTGIAPEFVNFNEGGNDFVAPATGKHYLLRPETVETLYILYSLTGDKTYREWGWEIFMAIESNCRTSVGYGSLSDVNSFFQTPMDRMESFFLAETLKYLYLLFDPDSNIDLLGRHVFNTEAHPLRIFPALKRENETCYNDENDIADINCQAESK